MFNYLLDHATKNVWCSPEQDNQVMFKPFRVTGKAGARNSIRFMGRYLDLPMSSKVFHVFNIGQYNPIFLNLLDSPVSWVDTDWKCFADAISLNNTFINLYTDYGVEIPKFNSYYKFTSERSLVIAIEENSKVVTDWENDDIYLRVYSNAYFKSIDANLANDNLHYTGKKIETTQDILSLQALCNSYSQLSGYTYRYKNGTLINEISLLTVAVGDVVELTYDPSVKEINTFNIADLKTFVSQLDNCYKYLLRCGTPADKTIDYQDDVDFYICYKDQFNNFKGFYLNRNSVKNYQMVTHCDYSVPVQLVSMVGSKLVTTIEGQNFSNLQNLEIKVFVRKSGYERPLIFDNNRIFELYKLDFNTITDSMLGLDSNVSVWKADELENSDYVKLMRSKRNLITMEMVQNAYGYNSISKLIADTPCKTTMISNTPYSRLPYGLNEIATVYEYDSNGLMLGYYNHSNDPDYYCINSNTAVVEALVGKGTYQPNVKFGFNNIELTEKANYRVYRSTWENGLSKEDWTDVTDGGGYTVTNNVLVWNNAVSDPNEQHDFLMIRFDDTFLAYELEITPIAGTIYFTLAELEDRGNGLLPYSLPVPMGELEIILNGNSLINGLDYFVNFPKVYVVNKKYLTQPANSTVQKLHIRFTGFCNKDLTMDDPDDHGFVEYGLLSNNNKFDIRDDKVLRIVVDGKLKCREDLVFSELHSGVYTSSNLNGLPYTVKDIVVPLRGLTNEDTYSLRNKSLAIDKQVSDYLSRKIPQPERGPVSVMQDFYPVISPFICHIVNDLVNNQFDETSINKNLTANDVLTICKPYEYLIDFDPINEANRPNSDYVIIHPHNLNNTIDLNTYQYQFLAKVVNIYCKGLIELSPFITISN